MTTPHAVQGNFQRQKDTGRGDEQHKELKTVLCWRCEVGQGRACCASRTHWLFGRKFIHHLADDVGHALGMEQPLGQA